VSQETSVVHKARLSIARAIRFDPQRLRHEGTANRGAAMSALILHEYSASGNCYKIRLTAAHLGIPLERREYDIMAGATRTPEFLGGVNANGRIPVLQVGDDYLPESGAA
jgi:hypothetical protein